MKTKVYLDMDGTIADLYAIENWLDRLIKQDHTVFLEAKPVITQEQLLEEYPESEYEIVILSMTPKGASQEYCERVEASKDIWLDWHFPKLTERIYMEYGHNKNQHDSHKAIIIDDSTMVRESWLGKAIMPKWGAALSI